METDLQDALGEEEFQQLSDIVHAHCGITLHDGKRDLVRARIVKQMRAGGFKTARDYLKQALADTSSAKFTVLIDCLCTNLTSFFRENDHLNYLTRHFLPALVNRKRAQENSRIRGWSAACSTGEEPYSLAMTILDFLGHVPGFSWDLKLLATDISTKVLRIAECATYERARVTSVPQPLQNKYLGANRIDEKTVYSIAPAVKEVVRFRHMNLMASWPFNGTFDFIFCRNVMIYFDKPTQQKLVNRCWDRLESGGLLFTGHSESLTGIDHDFGYIQPTIYVKR